MRYAFFLYKHKCKSVAFLSICVIIILHHFAKCTSCVLLPNYYRTYTNMCGWDYRFICIGMWIYSCLRVQNVQYFSVNHIWHLTLTYVCCLFFSCKSPSIFVKLNVMNRQNVSVCVRERDRDRERESFLLRETQQSHCVSSMSQCNNCVPDNNHTDFIIS